MPRGAHVATYSRLYVSLLIAPITGIGVPMPTVPIRIMIKVAWKMQETVENLDLEKQGTRAGFLDLYLLPVYRQKDTLGPTRGLMLRNS